jgi:clan AA aspartic protease (TIGR02281 family)
MNALKKLGGMFALSLVLFSFSTALAPCAENTPVIVYFKSGGRIEGILTDETDKGVTLNVGFGITVLSKEDILRIETPEKPSEKARILSKMHRYAYSAKEAEKRRADEQRSYFNRMREIIEAQRKALIRRFYHQGVDIEIKDRSRMIVEATVNGSVQFRLQLDTGANMVALSPSAATQLGMDLFGRHSVEVSLAYGNSVEGIPVKLRSVKVGDAEVRDCDAVIILSDSVPAGQDGYLGLSFLRYFDIKIDFAREKLFLTTKENDENTY